MLQADASVVDLNKLGPYYYQGGLHFVSLPSSDGSKIASLLPEVSLYAPNILLKCLIKFKIVLSSLKVPVL